MHRSVHQGTVVLTVRHGSHREGDRWQVPPPSPIRHQPGDGMPVPRPMAPSPVPSEAIQGDPMVPAVYARCGRTEHTVTVCSSMPATAGRWEYRCGYRAMAVTEPSPSTSTTFRGVIGRGFGVDAPSPVIELDGNVLNAPCRVHIPMAVRARHWLIGAFRWRLQARARCRHHRRLIITVDGRGRSLDRYRPGQWTSMVMI